MESQATSSVPVHEREVESDESTPKPTSKFSDEPPTKRKKNSNLEDRLSHILSCNVCFDLPSSACYQCCRGHLMCAACYNHLLADSKLKDEQPTCPSCRVDIGHGSCTRNLTAEKTISELPVVCVYCCGSFARHMIKGHQTEDCADRLVKCRFETFGCSWSGPYHESTNHESTCVHPKKSGTELLECLDNREEKHKKQLSVFRQSVSLLSCEQISFSDIQLRPFRTMDFVTRLYYESNRFHALGHTWAVKAFIDNVEKHPSNPTVIADRQLNYQLLLKSKVSNDLELYSLLVRAPFEETHIDPEPVFHRFTTSETESELRPISVADANRLLGSRVINLRLFLFYNKP
ncbi:zinc finger TRAF-type-containing protein 1-A-like [Styela clava]|uniref:cysteine and histidine-rich protein 1-like n=1 Tax=Styela clava TaxID=7725 RepID=UPI00193A1F82|nr:cysteine and histidine-rich protein 1-like [Styela clava]